MFCYRMALDLHMTVADLRERMTASELMGWIEYLRRRDEEPEQDTAEMDPKQIAAAFGADLGQGR